MGRWVHFRLKADNVRNDQMVAIIGDDSPLGDWSIKRPGWYPSSKVSIDHILNELAIWEL